MFFSRWFKKNDSPFFVWEAWMIHVATIIGISIAVLSAIYYFYRISPSISGLVLVFACIIGWATAPVVRRTHDPIRPLESSASLWRFGALFSLILVIVTLWISRTDDSIASPWQAVPSLLFVVYALGALFTILTARRAGDRWSLPIILLFGVATFGVSLIVYRLGFGYDPFVHQATERYIAEHGMISPKQPMYIGQYVSVVSLSWMTKLSIHRIDRMLAPILSVVFMLPMLFAALRCGWLKDVKKPMIGLLALFLIPSGYFAFTVPFNLALICLVLIVAFLPLSDRIRIRWLIGSLTVASVAIHPLIGIPASVIAICGVFKKIPSWIAGLLIPFGFMAAFSMYFRMQGAVIAFPTVDRIGTALRVLFSLPYELYLGKPYLSMFYSLLYLAPVLLISAGIYGYIDKLSKTDERMRFARLLGFASIGLIFGATLIPVLFTFPNIISSEQFEFSLRLLAIVPYLWLPGIAFALVGLFESKGRFRDAGIVAVLTLVLLGSWYASYPQVNDISYLPAPGLSRNDLDTVEFIEGNAQGAPYVVLAPQMTGAASLMNFGFDKQVSSRDGALYAYSIPTGGSLYAYYLALISSDESPVKIRSELNRFIDTPLVYVVIPASWDPEGEAMARLESITLAQYQIGGDRIVKLKAVGRE